MVRSGIVLSILLCSVLVVSALATDWVSLSETGTDPVLDLKTSQQTGLTFSFTLPGFETEAVTFQSETFKQVTFPGSGAWGTFGSPELPVYRRLMRLPDRSGWEWDVTSSDFIDLPNYRIVPYQEGLVESPDGPVQTEFRFNQNDYQQDRWFPATPVEIGNPAIMAGYRFACLEIHPVQYNPATGTLRVYRNLEVSVRFVGEGENPVEKVRSAPSRVFGELIEQAVINPGAFDATDEDGVLGGYLIITPPSLENSFWLQSFVLWKRQRGYPVTVVNTNTTGSSATAITSYITNNVYNVWPVPPDYLLLVGDEDYGMPTHIYSYSGNVTDLPYTLMEGNDYFPDILAGRLSIDSENELAIVCSKSINYEQFPDMVSTNWFTRGLMVYDFNGSLSCQNVKNRCRDLMLAHGYTQVDTVTNPPNYYGGTLINPIINSGVSYVNYRGYGAYNGWTPPSYYISDMGPLNNGFRLPVITSIVCGGGNFASSSYDPCFGEYWIRKGSSPNNVSGAVAFMGPSSLYTHTRWNNCIDGGVYQGIFVEGVEDVASALLRGKIELYYGMPNNQGSGSTTSSVECYFHIYNILGDPGLRLWTGVPQILTVIHPTDLPLGVNAFNATVTQSGSPVESALVCLYNSTTEDQYTAWTDENGEILLNLADAVAGSYTLTVTGKNLKTYQSSVTIAQEDVALGINSYVIDDDNTGESSGDGDGEVNPGETIELVVTLENSGSSITATGISGTVSSDDPYLQITENSLSGTSAAPGGTSPLNDDFNLVISAEAPHSHSIPVYLEAACNEGSWTNVINLDVVAPLAECIHYDIATGSGFLNPGEQADVTFELMSSGGDPLTDCMATLSASSSMLTVLDGDGSWGTIEPGISAENTANPFTLQASSSCPPGSVVPLDMIVTSENYCDTLSVDFVVGEINETDAVGPDSYGYYCFDSRDIGYEQIPVYDWIEASDMPGAETLSLPDYYEEQDVSVAHQLPFTFRYYGEDYSGITICSNGWISMGDSHNYVSARNWNIPGALGPPAMIAGFWDDLKQYGSSLVKYWYDSANHRVVVEWKDLRTLNGNGINRFEIILYDPAYYPTSTGDGPIMMQYHTFNNVDGNENFCTIGIENWEQSDGVLVTYASHYTTGSEQLQAGVALYYSTDVDYSTGAPDVQVTLTPATTPVQIPATGGSFDFNIAASNNETSPSNFDIWCDIILPNGSSYGPLLGPANITLGAGASLDRDRTQLVPANAPQGMYTYRAFAGAYPSMVFSSDSFPVEKLSDLYDIPISDWENYGEPFGEELDAIAANSLPKEYRIESITPNPFNPTTTITYALPEAALVTLEVFDITGRQVNTLIDGWRDAGYHQVEFDGSNLSSGIYFCRFVSNNRHSIQKLVLLK